MKKLIVLMLLVFVLVGCQPVKMSSPKGWALHYAEEAYLHDYIYKAFGYTMEEYSIYPVADEDTDFEDYDWACYRITFVDDTGGNVVYNVLVVYKKSFLEIFAEDNIVDVDIREGN